jgi:S1-C subfamily serine protease
MNKLATLATAVLLWAGTAAAGPPADGAGFLGVRLQRVEGGLAEALDLEPDSGVLVGQVVEGSPADEAGMKEGDIVVALDGKKVGTPDELRAAVRDHEAGDKVSVDVFRDGKKRRLEATLEQRDSSDRPTRARVHRPLREVREMRIGGERGWLGVHTQPLSGDLGEYFGTPGGGALVSEVVDDSPAAKLGLQAGDVIVRVDGEPIADPEDLRREIARHEEPLDVEITWLRDRAERSGQARLEVREGLAVDEILPPRGEGFGWIPRDEDMRERVHAFRMRASDETEKAIEELKVQVQKLSEELKKLERKVE